MTIAKSISFPAMGRAALGALFLYVAWPAGAAELYGAGATFPAPLYKAWIERFQKSHPSDVLRYDAVGSGEGLTRFVAGDADFAASDTPAPSMGSERGDGVGVQVPVTAGMIAIAYNLPGVGALKLPRAVYADIFAGRIRVWNDPRIAAANPGVALPDAPIRRVARVDSSGTTFAFTSHLAAIAPSWAEGGPGVGKLVNWSKDVVLAHGNDGVAGEIGKRPFAIGYVESNYARRYGLSTAALENREGAFVAPTREAGLATIMKSNDAGLDTLKDFLLDPTGPKTYPLVTYSWLILRWDYPANQFRAVSAFVDYILGDGQTLSAELGYLPLPPPVAHRGRMVAGRVIAREDDGESKFSTAVSGAVANESEAPAAKRRPRR